MTIGRSKKDKLSPVAENGELVVRNGDRLDRHRVRQNIDYLVIYGSLPNTMYMDWTDNNSRITLHCCKETSNS